MMVVAGIRPLAVFIVLLCGLLPLLGANEVPPALAPVAKEMQAPSLPLHGECMRPTANSIADWLYRDHKNYRAISQALYPSEGDHSLIVWIDIQWWNATEQPGVWDEWAWSTSCLYVVLPLDLFPLLSIWVFNPQQRMQEVTVSLPPFCENVTAEQANSALYLSIKRMEAYVRNRDDPDPNMSMAQCVVAFDQNGNVTPDSDEIGMGKAYFLFYLNLGGIGLLMLALVFLAIQYIVDWINVDRHEAADGDTGYPDVGGGGGGGGHDKDHQHRFGIASLDGRGRPSAAEPPDYGSAGHLYVNDLGNVVRVDSDADADVDTDESEAEEAGPGTGEGGEAPRSIYAAVTPDLYTRAVGYETGSAAAAARRNSRHRLHEGEVAQIKGQLQRSRARIMRLRSELGSAEEDLSLGSAAASMRAAGRIRTVRGEARMIEQEIHLCESEAAMVEAAGACSLLKAKEMKYDFLMVKRELLDLRKRLWEVEKAARTAEDELQRRTQSSAVWETYLKALVGSPLLCDLLCAGFLVFLIDFYISMLGPFAKPAVVPLFVVNLLCFVPWAIDFVHHRLGSLLFLFCCSCFLLCERRRTGRHDPIVPPEEGEEGEAAAAKRRSANVWVLLPVVIVFALHFAFFLQWIALATMFDFAYSLEIICILAVMLFHLFMGVKIVLKVVRHIKEDEAEVEARRKTRERTREETGYETMFGGDHKAEYAAAHAINEEEEEEYRRQGLARAFGWCPGPVRACLGSWVWFLLMMLSLLAALVVFLVWLHAGYHTFARQHTAGLQFLLTIITLLVLVLERQIINLDMSRRGAVRSFPRLVRRLLAGGHR